jgi:hypothetical protein
MMIVMNQVTIVAREPLYTKEYLKSLHSCGKQFRRKHHEFKDIEIDNSLKLANEVDLRG